MSSVSYSCDGYEVEIDSVSYIFCLYAEAEYSYIPGRMYMKNGDPGYPDDKELEVTFIEMSIVTELDSGKIVTDKVILQKIEDKVADELYEMNIEKWSGQDPYDEEEW
jgi:hypothetical protein